MPIDICSKRVGKLVEGVGNKRRIKSRKRPITVLSSLGFKEGTFAEVPELAAVIDFYTNAQGEGVVRIWGKPDRTRRQVLHPLDIVFDAVLKRDSVRLKAFKEFAAKLGFKNGAFLLRAISDKAPEEIRHAA